MYYHSCNVNLYLGNFLFVHFCQIMVCSNHMNIQDEVNQVVIHELIHAFDDCRAKNLEWANCAHHACSEVRMGVKTGLLFFWV